MTPTKKPTKSPSKSPTITPTKKPTLSPTVSPFSPFFGAGSGSIGAGGVKNLDLFVLIDVSGSVDDNDNSCKQAKTISGINPKSCIDLILDTVKELIKRLGDAIDYQSSTGTIDEGLRVFISGFSCKSGQRNPIAYDIVKELSGSKNIIMNAIDEAQNELKPDGGSCPQLSLSQMIREIENKWSDSDKRPFKILISMTDAIIYDASGNGGLSTSNAINGMRDRCVKGITVTPGGIGTKNLNAKEKEVQRRYLDLFTSNDRTRQFELSNDNNNNNNNDQQSVIDNIGISIGDILLEMNSNSLCKNKQSFNTPDKYWCGYSEPTPCKTRESCEWIDGNGIGCRKISSFVGCDYNKKKDCKNDSQCKWKKSIDINTGKKKNICLRKPMKPDCDALTLKQACKAKSKFCKWDKSNSKCITRSKNKKNKSG